VTNTGFCMECDERDLCGVISYPRYQQKYPFAIVQILVTLLHVLPNGIGAKWNPWRRSFKDVSHSDAWEEIADFSAYSAWRFGMKVWLMS